VIIFESFGWDGYFTWRRGKLTWIQLEDQGLVQIKGGNGSGKSSIFNALAHVLYGQTPNKKAKGASIVAEGGCHGVINFRKEGGSKYRVEQRRKGKSSPSLKIYEDEVDVTPKKERYGELHNLVAEILGISFRQFINTVYIPQRSTHLLIHSQPAARRDFLAGLFGINTIDDVLSVVTARKKGLSESLQDLDSEEGKLSLLKEELDELPDVEELERNAAVLGKTLKKLRKELNEVVDEIADMEDELRDAREHAELSKVLGDVDLSALQADYKSAKNRLKKTQVQKGKAEAAKRFRDRKERLQKQLDDLDRPFMTSDTLRKEIVRLQKLHAKQETELRQTKKVLNVQGDCPVCMQPVTEEYRDSLKNRRKHLAKGKKGLESDLDKHEDALQDAVVYEDLERKINDLGEDFELDYDLDEVLAKEEGLTKKVKKLKTRANAAHELEELGEVRTVKRCKVILKKLDALKEKLEGKIDEVAKTLGRVEGDLDAVDAKRRAIKRMSKRVKRMSKSRDDAAILAALGEALGNRKTQWLNQAVDALGERLPYHLDVLFPEPGILFDLSCTARSFKFDVERYKNRRDSTKGQERYDVSCFSGGEEARLSLGLQLAIHDISATAATNLLILDEPDKHLDDEGKDGFATKLNELRGVKGTVLVTSHGPGLSESDLYDRALQVRIRKASSTLKVIR